MAEIVDPKIGDPGIRTRRRKRLVPPKNKIIITLHGGYTDAVAPRGKVER